MANSKLDIEILGVNDVARCAEVMRELRMTGQPIAMDAEGVNLGATGRMTLLQFKASNGKIFILDLVDPSNRSDTLKAGEFIKKGGVEELLKSNVLKVCLRHVDS